MFIPHFLQPRIQAGLDIQDKTIRLLQLRQTRKKIIVEQAVQIRLPAEFSHNEVTHQSQIISSHLKELMRLCHIKQLSAAVALPASFVISKHIQLPKELSGAELEAEIALNLNVYFPHVAESLCYDYVKLNSYDDLQDEVLLVAARSEQLTSYVKMIEAAGIQVHLVEVDYHVVERATSFLKKQTIEMLDESKWLLSLGLALRGLSYDRN